MLIDNAYFSNIIFLNKWKSFKYIQVILLIARNTSRYRSTAGKKELPAQNRANFHGKYYAIKTILSWVKILIKRTLIVLITAN